MSRITFISLALPLVALLALGGCGKTADADGHKGHDEPKETEHSHGESEHEHEEDEGPVKFKEGLGLQLSAETIAALGMKTGEVQERSIHPTYEVTAAVFDAGPPAQASALVPVEIAEELEKHPPTGARLLSVRRDLSLALSQTEIVFALPGTPAVGATVELLLHGPARQSLAIPRSALLRSADGTHVYVALGAHLRRTPVKLGASDGEYLEILAGLQAGDLVATAAVEQLWLTELRLTKGGGHSH